MKNTAKQYNCILSITAYPDNSPTSAFYKSQDMSASDYISWLFAAQNVHTDVAGVFYGFHPKLVILQE